ncbi:MAG: NAD-dependent epimerase/dehydratase family protein [Candidatus Delongbacteria bacterium]|nr:NAD-dependent epimerase/dehydratase family protein [Candidatus Delongbacteria bacterium]
MRLVLTGASGFLGGHLLVELLRRKIPVLALGRAPEELSRRLGTGVAVARFDLGNPGPTAALRAGDTVIHMAALLGAGVSDRALMLRANREATILLAREAIDAGAADFVFLSSVSAHGPHGSQHDPLREDSRFAPVSAYGESKARAEEDLAALDFGTTRLLVLRPPVIYGTGANPVSSTVRLLRLLGGRVFLRSGGGRALFNVIAVENLVHGLFHLLEHAPRGAGLAGCAWMLRDDPCPSMAAFQDRILQVYGRRPLLLPAPRWLLEPLGSLGDLLRARTGWHAPLSREIVAGFSGDGYWSSIDRISALGWRPPVNWQDALGRTAQEYRATMAGARNN